MTSEKVLQKLENDKRTVLDILLKITRHQSVKLVHRGNAAILCALHIVKKVNSKPFILIPDQGGWISFKTYPKMFGFDIKTVKTNKGIIDLTDLEEKAESGAALLMTSFAGYFAEQPMKYISKICKRSNCLLIEDASGAVGDKILCDGAFSDIIVASFGKWKPVNVGYGGFISVCNKELFEAGKDIFSATNHYPCYDKLLQKLKASTVKINNLIKKASKIKEDLTKQFPDLKIIHKDLRGLNVVIKYAEDSEKETLEKYCSTNKLDYVVCPKYIRLEENAISIELKRKDI